MEILLSGWLEGEESKFISYTIAAFKKEGRYFQLGVGSFWYSLTMNLLKMT